MANSLAAFLFALVLAGVIYSLTGCTSVRAVRNVTTYDIPTRTVRVDHCEATVISLARNSDGVCGPDGVKVQALPASDVFGGLMDAMLVTAPLIFLP